MKKEIIDGIPCVTITEAQFNQLRKDSDFLGKLYAAGVDNWEGFSECQSEEDEE